MQSAPDVRSSAGQAMISQIEATSRGKLNAANLAAQREKDDLFNPEFAELSVEDPYLNDVSTPSDKQKATIVAYKKFEGVKLRRDSNVLNGACLELIRKRVKNNRKKAFQDATAYCCR
jgi:hypothetical protein